ncbi:MAG: biopolymer transporter ExbD [Planctomycetota bacterium]
MSDAPEPDRPSVLASPAVIVALTVLVLGVAAFVLFGGRTEPEPQPEPGKKADRSTRDSTAPKESKKKSDEPVEIRVRKDGSISFKGNTVTLDELESALRDVAREAPDRAVRIGAPPTTEWRHVAPVVDLCEDIGLRNTSHDTAEPDAP